jgi:glycerol uptake facilitator-like aquaporin
VKRALNRLLAAELIGTFILVLAGCGAVLAVMFGGPSSGASMSPARSLGPALVSGDLHALWLDIVAPLLGTSFGALSYRFVRGEPEPAL